MTLKKKLNNVQHCIKLQTKLEGNIQARLSKPFIASIDKFSFVSLRHAQSFDRRISEKNHWAIRSVGEKVNVESSKYGYIFSSANLIIIELAKLTPRKFFLGNIQQ